MKLKILRSTHGASMGRCFIHAHGVERLQFELEWVPFMDGAYDAGGAYWGAPDNLYCAVARSDNQELVRAFYRASSREDAKLLVLEDYPESEFEVENGSLIEQMIETLEEYKAGLDIDDELMAEELSEDILGLESMLEDLK